MSTVPAGSGASGRRAAAPGAAPPAADGTVLVVGSYPPVPSASTAAAVDAVRGAWAAGKATVVLSPRPTAADLTARVDGLLAGRHLRTAQQETAATELVLCAEPGLPVHERGGALHLVDGWLTCALLARAAAGFAHVTVVESGMTSTPPGWRLVRARADEVRSHPERRGRDGVRPTPSLGDSAEQYRNAARLVLKRVIGPRAPELARAVRRIRALAEGALGRTHP